MEKVKTFRWSDKSKVLFSEITDVAFSGLKREREYLAFISAQFKPHLGWHEGVFSDFGMVACTCEKDAYNKS